MKRRTLIFFLLILTLLLPLTAAAWTLPFFSDTTGFVPRAADTVSKELDSQILRYLSPDGYGRDSVSIAFTVPVALGNLNDTSPLARQMAEEVARWFVQAGYQVDEIRKGNEILMVPQEGEFLLTRDTRKLANRNVLTVAVLTGTYTTTPDSVRFNLRLIHTPSNAVLAMGTVTVPITSEILPLLADSRTPPLAPSVQTRLQR